tara:strand:- start:16210 stop:16428 length:219 start_codon:yes stop_codon:yes gene_type:complete
MIQIMNNEVVKKAANTAANIIVEEISSQIFNTIVNYDTNKRKQKNVQLQSKSIPNQVTKKQTPRLRLVSCRE